VGAKAVRFKEMCPTVAFCTTSPFTNPLLKLFENGEGVQLGLLVVTLLCGTASRLASSLPSSLPCGRWSFGPGGTCCSKVALFSYHVSNKVVLGRKMSHLLRFFLHQC